MTFKRVFSIENARIVYFSVGFSLELRFMLQLTYEIQNF